MKRRNLAGHEVGAIGLGCMSFGGIYGPSDEATTFACLERALEVGITHWDVAEAYGAGQSERLLGRFLAASSAQVTLATKAGIYRQPDRHFSNDADRLRASLEGSLSRLRRSSVELFYVHRRDHSIEIEAVVETLVGFQEEGMIGAFGFSEIAPSSLRRAHAVHPVAAVQSEYSLWTRQPEQGMVQSCADLGVTFVPFSPLGRGVFSDHFAGREAFGAEDFRRSHPRFNDPNYAANLALIEPFKAFCASRGWTTAAVALAWLLSRGPHLVPIPGTRSAAHLDEWVQAADLVLSAQDLAEIDRLLPPGFAHGARYHHAHWAGIEQYG